jgi:hypothetical protein
MTIEMINIMIYGQNIIQNLSQAFSKATKVRALHKPIPNQPKTIPIKSATIIFRPVGLKFMISLNHRLIYLNMLING